MVSRLIITILLSGFVFMNISGQKNLQQYVGRTLGDSTVQFSDLQPLNYKYFYGRYTNSYGAPQKVKFGSMFNFAGDSVTVTASGGTGDVNQNGNSYGATMSIGTNDNNQFRLRTNGVERFSITTGTSTGGLFNQNYVTATTNAVVDAITINATSTGTIATNFGSGFKFTAPSNTGIVRDLAYISPYWTSATNSLENSAIKFRIQNFGTISTEMELMNSNIGGGVLKLNSVYPLTIDGLNFAPNVGYTFGPCIGPWTMTTSQASNAAAINLSTTGSGSGTTISNGTFSAANPTSSASLIIDGSVTATGAGSNNYTALSINNTFSESGGHTGITRGLYVNNTLTAPNDYRAVDIATSSGKGVYQSNTTIQNNLSGKTNIGSTGDPIVKLKVSGRFAAAKGANIASTGNLTLGADGNCFTITGTTTINTIDATNWIAGSVVYLIFSGSVTVSHNTAGTGARIYLAGSINYAAVNNSTLTLVYDGSVWQELSRKNP
ncbi:MAG TPA: hypothetical protein PKK64_09735 [Saprospiraceae bacterium]|nr:hypothetical protein [Saprospiraceae bacterium]